MKNLDDALARLASQSPAPALPENFESNVWRSIRQRRGSGARESLVDSLLNLLFRPAGFASAVVVTLAVAVSIGSLDAPRGALDLGVFSSRAPSLPSTLMNTPR